MKYSRFSNTYIRFCIQKTCHCNVICGIFFITAPLTNTWHFISFHAWSCCPAEVQAEQITLKIASYWLCGCGPRIMAEDFFSANFAEEGLAGSLPELLVTTLLSSVLANVLGRDVTRSLGMVWIRSFFFHFFLSGKYPNFWNSPGLRIRFVVDLSHEHLSKARQTCVSCLQSVGCWCCCHFNKTFRSVSDQHCSKCSKQCQLARTLMEGTSSSLRFVGDCFCHLLAIIASAFRQCCGFRPRHNGSENGTKSKLPKRRHREVSETPGSCGNCGSCLPCQALLQRATSTGRSS